MFLTAKSHYAIIAMLELANAKSIKINIKAKTISEKYNIDFAYLERVLSKLKSKKLIKSIKGPGGGYILNDSIDSISILSIMDAVQERIRITRCKEGKEGCMNNTETKCLMHHTWLNMETVICQYLSSIKLSDFSKQNVECIKIEESIQNLNLTIKQEMINFSNNA